MRLTVTEEVSTYVEDVRLNYCQYFLGRNAHDGAYGQR